MKNSKFYTSCNLLIFLFWFFIYLSKFHFTHSGLEMFLSSFSLFFAIFTLNKTENTLIYRLPNLLIIHLSALTFLGMSGIFTAQACGFKFDNNFSLYILYTLELFGILLSLIKISPFLLTLSKTVSFIFATILILLATFFVFSKETSGKHQVLHSSISPNYLWEAQYISSLSGRYQLCKFVIVFRGLPFLSRQLINNEKFCIEGGDSGTVMMQWNSENHLFVQSERVW